MLIERVKAPLRSVFSLQQRHRLKTLVSPLYRNDLAKLALLFGTDKAGRHHYTRHYQHHLGHLRQREVNILEIGVGGYDDPRAGGESLRMWKAFFPKARIYGIDIHDKSPHDQARIKTFRGSQADAAFLQRVVEQIGTIDVVIDDGSHHNDHVITSFNVLFPLLAPRGIYAIEDTQTSYWEEFDGERFGGSIDLQAPHTMMNFFKSLVDGLNFQDFPPRDYAPTYFDRHIVALHFYHNLVFVQKGLNDEESFLTSLIRNRETRNRAV